MVGWRVADGRAGFHLCVPLDLVLDPLTKLTNTSHSIPYPKGPHYGRSASGITEWPGMICYGVHMPKLKMDNCTVIHVSCNRT